MQPPALAHIAGPALVRCQTPAAMVNYKRVVCEVAVVALLAAVTTAAPADCAREPTHYDQRQNGTENYRLNIDGVVIAVAPAESLLSAVSDLDLSDLIDLEDFGDDKPKPPQDLPSKPQLEPKPEGGKPEKPQDGKPDKPEELKPEEPLSPLSDVSLSDDTHKQRIEGPNRKQEKGQRLKHRLISMLAPLLRRNRHH